MAAPFGRRRNLSVAFNRRLWGAGAQGSVAAASASSRAGLEGADGRFEQPDDPYRRREEDRKRQTRAGAEPTALADLPHCIGEQRGERGQLDRRRRQWGGQPGAGDAGQLRVAESEVRLARAAGDRSSSTASNVAAATAACAAATVAAARSPPLAANASTRPSARAAATSGSGTMKRRASDCAIASISHPSKAPSAPCRSAEIVKLATSTAAAAVAKTRRFVDRVVLARAPSPFERSVRSMVIGRAAARRTGLVGRRSSWRAAPGRQSRRRRRCE